MRRTDDWIVKLPVQNPNIMAFCGPDLRELYVTSATHGKRGNTNEGGIFRVRVDVPGLARPFTPVETRFSRRRRDI